MQELINKLDKSDRAELHAWLYELGHSQEAIFKSLKKSGHVVGKQTINRHRSQACRCFQ